MSVPMGTVWKGVWRSNYREAIKICEIFMTSDAQRLLRLRAQISEAVLGRQAPGSEPDFGISEIEILEFAQIHMGTACGPPHGIGIGNM